MLVLSVDNGVIDNFLLTETCFKKLFIAIFFDIFSKFEAKRKWLIIINFISEFFKFK